MNDGSSIYYIYIHRKHVSVNEINNIIPVNIAFMHQYYFPFPSPHILSNGLSKWWFILRTAHSTCKVVWKACSCNIRSIDETNGIQSQLNNNTTKPLPSVITTNHQYEIAAKHKEDTTNTGHHFQQDDASSSVSPLTQSVTQSVPQLLTSQSVTSQSVTSQLVSQSLVS